MSAAFEFTAPPRIVFGPGTVRRIGEFARALGRRAFLVGGSQVERLGPMVDMLSGAGVEVVVFCVSGEPTLASARQATGRALAAGADVVIGVGGGSALDTAKAVAALAANGGDPLDYVEVIGKGEVLKKPSLPVLAVPTTAGTGSEVTRNAVLASPDHGIKVSLRGSTMIPRVALVDPELTWSLPPAATATTGLDALTQLIEPYTSCRANPMVDALCREGMARVGRSLRRAWADGRDAEARADMALASLFGGLALAHAGLGIVHGIAGPAGGMFPAAHGALCAALLPFGFEANRAALENRDPDNPVLARYDEIAQILTGRAEARAADGVEWLKALNAELGVPPLSSYGVGRQDLPQLAEKARSASSTQANPIALSADEVHDLLMQALQ